MDDFDHDVTLQAAQLPQVEAVAVFKRFDKNRDRHLDFGELCAGLGLPVPSGMRMGGEGPRGQSAPAHFNQASLSSGGGGSTAAAAAAAAAASRPLRTARSRVPESARSAAVSAMDMKARENLLNTPRTTANPASRVSGLPLATDRSARPRFEPSFEAPGTARAPVALPQLTQRGGAYTPRDSNVALAAALSARRKNEKRLQQQPQQY